MAQGLWLVLLEGAFVAATVLVVCVLLAWHFRRRYLRLLDKYKALASKVRVGTTLGCDIAEDAVEQPVFNRQSLTPLAYLQQELAATNARFHAQAESKLIALESHLPFSAKICALRSIYLNAECEAYSLAEIPHSHWQKLERGLAQIMGKLFPTIPGADEVQAKTNQLELLRERLAKLKPFEKKCRQLQHKLELAEARLAEVDQARDQSRDGFLRLKEINRSLANLGVGDWQQPGSYSEEQILDQAEQHVAGVASNLGSIHSLYGRQREAGEQLVEDISSLAEGELDAYKREQLLGKINSLREALGQSEVTVETLENCVATLQQQLLDARRSLAGPVAGGSGEELAVVVRESAEQSEPHWQAVDNKKVVLDEVRHLQDNNYKQRNLIADLEREISALKQSLLQNTELSEEEIKEKLGRIAELEQTVRECESCIATLESEVEMLYEKLEQSREQDEARGDDLSSVDEIHRLNSEIDQLTEMMGSTMMLYGDQSLIAKFAMESSRISELSDLIKLVDQTVRAVGLVPAVYIRTRKKTCELIPKKIFMADEISKLKSEKSPSGNVLSPIGEAILLTQPSISVLIRGLPDNEERATQLTDFSSTLFNLAVAEVDRIVSVSQSLEQKTMMEKLLRATKKQIHDVDVQQTYQNEEMCRVHSQLAGELNNIINTVDLPSEVREILQLALQESHERMALLFATGTLMDDNFTQLIEKLSQKID